MIIAWFSCGVTSAVACKIALNLYNDVQLYYIGDGGWIGYEVSASNDDGIEYYEVDCEGLLFHIYEIQKFMRYENIEPRSMLGNFSNKHLLSDDSLNKLLNMSENKNYCKTNPYE